MSHVELTDEPCPKCGASLDVKVSLRAPDTSVVADPRITPDNRTTISILREKTCPECGWSQTL